MHDRGRDVVLVASPSFGRFSTVPAQRATELGLELRPTLIKGPLSAEDLTSEVVRTRARALLVGLDEVSAKAIAGFDGVQVVAKHGVGVDNIDVDAAEAKGIRVVNAPGGNADAVADLTMGLILGSTRHILQADATLRAGDWRVFAGRQMSELSLGIVGYGRIGQAVAQRALAFGTRILAYDPFLPDEAFGGVIRVGLDELLVRSDIVSLHMPGGNRILDATALAAMKEGAFLINAARGDLVDEGLVARMLTDGRLAGAAFDAFSAEPPSGSPLLDAPNTILTPHIGAYTDAANTALGVTVVEDISRVLHGEEPLHPVARPHLS